MTRSEILQVVKPILFNTEMVRAILDGRKMVTRRVAKPQHLRVLDSPYHKEHPEVPDKVLIEKLCKPPYKPGDYLYVRETWAKMGIDVDSIFFERSESLVNGEIIYKSDGWDLNDIGRWHPSIHMPKEAARIFLRVTDVRVERLQEIDENGILAEGIDNGRSNPAMGKRWENMQRMEFKSLWDSTIPPKDRDKYAWAANPWVFVIEFERVKVTE